MLWVDKFKARESFQEEWEHNPEGILSEGLSNANSFTRDERQEAHGVVFHSLAESFGFELVMIRAPLI